MSQIITGTSHFVTVNCAVTYYRTHGYSRDEVMQKLKEKEIHIGEPPLQPGDKLSIIFGEGRYQITRNHPEKKLKPFAPFVHSPKRIDSMSDEELLRSLGMAETATGVMVVRVTSRDAKGKIQRYHVCMEGDEENIAYKSKETWKSRKDAQKRADLINGRTIIV